MHARVFVFGEEKFSPYLGAQYSLLRFEDKPFSQSSGEDLTFDKKYSLGNSFEFGFAYAARQMRLLFAIQYVKPPPLTVAAVDANGTAMYSVLSDVAVVIPKVGLEINLRSWRESRFFLEAQYGAASTTIANTFTFAPTSTFGLANFKEEVKGSGAMMQGGVGFEMNAFDSTTMLISLGYRSMPTAGYTHNLGDITNFQGAIAKGVAATNNNGSARDLDFTGYYASIYFRFWLF